MTRTFSLQPLQHLAQQKNDAAIKKLGLLNHSQQSAEAKLAMLQQYRRDYQQKLQAAESSGMELQAIRNFQDFIYRLDDAILQQSAAVEQTKNSVALGRSELSETQRRMKSYDILAQRHVETEKKLEAKTEQRIQDEHNGQRAARKSIHHQEESN